MKHGEEFAPLLSAFVDGELTEEERAGVLAHLEECGECRARLDELLALHAAFDGWAEEEVPAGFAEGVMAAVRAERTADCPQRKKRGARRWMPMAACAALLLLAMAVTIPRMGMKQANETTLWAADANGNKSGGAPADGTAGTLDAAPAPETQQDYEEQRCDAVQYATAGEMRTAKVETAQPAECWGERMTLGESGEEGSVLVCEYGTVLVELRGAGAAAYAAEHGVPDGAGGCYYLPIAALEELPEGLTLSELETQTLAQAPAEAEWVLVCPNDETEVTQP